MSTVLWLALVVVALTVGLLAGSAGNADEKVPAEFPIDQLSALSRILDVLPDVAAVVDRSNKVIATSSNCVAMGLTQGGELLPDELRNLNQEAHLQGKTVSDLAVISRSALSAGDWEARIQVSPLESGYSLVLAQDLSEERRLNNVRRDFVVNVSHELKTPIGALSLLAEGVQAAGDDVEQARHFAARMQIEVHRLTELIADLVELSRVQSDAPLRNSSAVRVSDLIAEAVDSMKIVADKRGIQLNVATEKTQAMIFGDEGQLVTALRNLVSNAINYSADGTKIGIGVRDADEFVEITVTDQGIGISDQDQARIFERFYRADPARSRETGGTGLGLAIVKHVCANHGGDCRVWSKPGEGSTFTLHFPKVPTSSGGAA